MGQASRLHERMPVIVPPDAFDLWLDCGKVDAITAAAALFAPAPQGLFEAYEISPAVNQTERGCLTLSLNVTLAPIL